LRTRRSMFSLFDAQCNDSSSSMNQSQDNPSHSFDDFYKQVTTHFASLRRTTATEGSEECILCTERKIDVCRLYRSCKVSPYPCEGHECCCKVSLSYSSSSTLSETHSSSPLSSPAPSSSSSPSRELFPACSKCVALILYSNTNDFMKKNGRWRAHCPFCKAEFCHYDLILLSPPPLPPLPTPTTSTFHWHQKYNKSSNKRNKKLMFHCARYCGLWRA